MKLKTTNLDLYAAELPPCLQPHYLAEVVRAFCGARGLTEENDLYDYWHEAVLVAVKKRYLALRRGADHVAYIKRGVKSLLTDLNRKLDIRREKVTSLAATSDENADEDERRESVIDDFERSAFEKREECELKRLDDVRIAIYATIADSPALAAYYRAFAATNGSDREVAKRLGLYRKTVAKYHRRIFLKRFKENYFLIREIRGKTV